MPQDPDKVRVREVRHVRADLASLANRRQQERGLVPIVDATWIELVCENDSAFLPKEQDLIIAVPPCDVAKGDLIEPCEAEHVATTLPPPPASLGLGLPVSPDSASVPERLTYAHRLTRAGRGWTALCTWPPVTQVLFETDGPQATVDAVNAFAKVVAPEPVRIESCGSDQMALTGMRGEVLAWSAAPVSRSVPFALAVAATDTRGWMRFRESAKLTVARDAATGLVMSDEHGNDARCALTPPFDPPRQLPGNYFREHARGRVEALRISKPGGLGWDALGAIAACRRFGRVTLMVDEQKRLVIAKGPNDMDPHRVEGAGVTTLDGRRNVPVEVPYTVALAIADGANNGAVEMTVDEAAGSLFREDYNILLQWPRHRSS
ncbi:MAG: hypothetical protein ACYCSI_04825 [Solirubrobacteraceae bacterium]